MPKTKITWSLTADVENDEGKESHSTQPTVIEVGGDGSSREIVRHGAVAFPIDVPAREKGRVEFFLLKPTVQGEGPLEKVWYAFTANAHSPFAEEECPADKRRGVPLNGVQLFTAGAAEWFDPSPTVVYVWNGSDSHIELVVFVGRQVTDTKGT